MSGGDAPAGAVTRRKRPARRRLKRKRKKRQTVLGFWKARAVAFARAVAGACRALLPKQSDNRVLLGMLAGSILLHAVLLALFLGFRFGSGPQSRSSGLVSEEILIEMTRPTQPFSPPVRLPELKHPPAPALPNFKPAGGKPINVLTAGDSALMPGLPSGGEDLKSLLLGHGGPAAGLLGSGSRPRSFSLGGGTVRASALIILLDASGSMHSEGKLEKARKKILDLTKQSGVKVMAEIEVPNCAFLQLAEPGADPFYPMDAAYAMSAAMRRFPFADAVYFFSDFQDAVEPDVVKQLRLIATGTDPKVRIYLHTLEESPDRSLTDLCRATGGQVLK